MTFESWNVFSEYWKFTLMYGRRSGPPEGGVPYVFLSGFIFSFKIESTKVSILKIYLRIIIFLTNTLILHNIDSLWLLELKRLEVGQPATVVTVIFGCKWKWWQNGTKYIIWGCYKNQNKTSELVHPEIVFILIDGSSLNVFLKQ